MTLILDAGAFIAIERGDRTLAALMRSELVAGRIPKTHGGVVAQVWRGAPRQALLARALQAVDVIPLSRGLGSESGRLLGAAGMTDVVDAAVVCIAGDGDTIVTSDPSDLARLADAAGADVAIAAI